MIILVLVYLLSHLFFLQPFPVFYDSFEYVQLAEKLNLSNFRQTIASSHQPIHTFYFLTITFLKTLLPFFSTEKILVSIPFLFGLLTLIFWYLFLKNFLDSQKAFFASLSLLLFPYFFLTNTNILYESELLFFQVISLFYYAKALQSPQKQRLFLFLSSLFFSFSLLVFPGSLFWLPLFFWLTQQIASKSKKIFFFFSLQALFFTFTLDFLLLSSPQTFILKYQPHLSDFTSSNQGILVFGYRLLRNIFLQTLIILSPLGLLLLTISLASLLRQKKLNVFTFVSWFFPAFCLMQFWHSGLWGRLSLTLVLPASFFFSQTFTTPFTKILSSISLLLFLLPQTFSQTKTPPIYRYFNLIKDIPNPAIITSDPNRFLYQKNNLPVFVFGPDCNLASAEEFIKSNLQKGNTVLIDSSGINYPRLQFDGHFYHPLSLHPRLPPCSQPLLQKFNQEIFKKDPSFPQIYFSKLIPKNCP